MNRRRNFSLWTGFLVIVGAVFTYYTIFIRFPITRDFPWVSFLLFVVGGGLLALGLKRAFKQPELYGGKVSGAILTLLSLSLMGLFVFGFFYSARQLPTSIKAPKVGQKAPDFTLPDQDGNPVTLSTLLASPNHPAASGANKITAVVLIFYRGYW